MLFLLKTWASQLRSSVPIEEDLSRMGPIRHCASIMIQY